LRSLKTIYQFWHQLVAKKMWENISYCSSDYFPSFFSPEEFGVADCWLPASLIGGGLGGFCLAGIGVTEMTEVGSMLNVSLLGGRFVVAGAFLGSSLIGFSIHL